MFERVFKDFGLPLAIRTDNGVPFASPNSFFGLTQAVGLVAAARDRHRAHQARASAAERSPRAHASDAEAGSHQAARPRTSCSSRRKFDQFIAVLQPGAPHQALNMRYPAELYSPSPRPYTGLTRARVSLPRPHHHRDRCGRICMGTLKINLSNVFAGQKVGSEGGRGEDLAGELYALRLRASSTTSAGRVNSAENPFAAKVLPMSPV